MPARRGPGPRGPRPAGVLPERGALLRLRASAGRIDLGPRRRAPDPLSGTRPSRHRARGMEYAESRAYLPGDEIRNMDWRVTARTGRPHTKLFQEERERPVILAVDYGPGMFFGTRAAFKSVVAAHAAALVAWAAFQRGDHVGAVITAPASQAEIRAAGGRRGVLRVLRALEVHAALPPAPGSRGPSRLAELLERVRRLAGAGGMVLVLSDFHGLDAEAQRPLAALARAGDLAGARVVDALERRPPPPGRYAVSDGRATALLDSRPRALREGYRQRFEAHAEEVRAAFARLGAPLAVLDGEASIEEALIAGLGRAGARAA